MTAMGQIEYIDVNSLIISKNRTALEFYMQPRCIING